MFGFQSSIVLSISKGYKRNRYGIWFVSSSTPPPPPFFHLFPCRRRAGHIHLYTIIMFRFVTILALVIVASLLTAAAPAGKIFNTPAAHNTKRSSYSGKGTFFTPSINGGSTGSCGEYEADDEYVVALVR